MIIGYEAACTTVAAATGAAFSEFECNGTRRAYIREIGVFSQAATAISKGQLGRPANTPTAGTLILGQAQDPSNAAATAGFTVTWTTAPTAPTVPMRQFDFNNVPGSGVIFTWPADGELVAGPTRVNSILLWNAGAATGPACSQYATFAE